MLKAAPLDSFYFSSTGLRQTGTRPYLGGRCALKQSWKSVKGEQKLHSRKHQLLNAACCTTQREAAVVYTRRQPRKAAVVSVQHQQGSGSGCASKVVELDLLSGKMLHLQMQLGEIVDIMKENAACALGQQPSAVQLIQDGCVLQGDS